MLALLHRLPALVEERHGEGDDAAIRLADFPLGVDDDPGVDGITDKDGSQELPAQLQKRQCRADDQPQTVQQPQVHVVNQRPVRHARPEGARAGKLFVNVDKRGNMSAASTIVALDEAVKAGRVKTGDKVLLVTFGSGFTWGACVIEW